MQDVNASLSSSWG